MCHEICIQYGFTELNKDTLINTECATYILSGGIHFDLCIKMCKMFFFYSDLDYMVGDLNSAVALLSNKD